MGTAEGQEGQDLGEIKELTQNYIRLEKGVVNKDKYWVPKYVADAYDGKVLWLLVSGDGVAKGYSYTTEPAKEHYTRELEVFKAMPYGQRMMHLPDFDQNIRMTGERLASRSEVQNIRDLN